MIVSDIAGTTRDAIDTADRTYCGREYVFIDTAGLRRKSKIKEELERYSIIRAVTAVERADVVADRDRRDRGRYGAGRKDRGNRA